MNLPEQVEPLGQYPASKASSRGGMHTAKRRNSLSIQQWLKRASKPSRTPQGARNPHGGRGVLPAGPTLMPFPDLILERSPAGGKGARALTPNAA